MLVCGAVSGVVSKQSNTSGIREARFFFFTQRPAYGMRISDWSSDVCSSDLGLVGSADYVARTFASRAEPSDPAQKALPSFLREDQGALQRKQIGRASCRERVCQYV